MLFLILSIAAMSAFMLTLKYFAAKKISSSQAIIVNYVLGTIIGIYSALQGAPIDVPCDFGALFNRLFRNDWWYLAVVAGLLLFWSMHLMAASTKYSGVSITTLSARTSLILPIIFSAIFFGEAITAWQAAGIILVIASFMIIFYNKRGHVHDDKKGAALKAVLMPAGVFLTVGIVTVCLKSAQQVISHTGNYTADYPIYKAMNFATAMICSMIYYVATEGKKAFIFSWKSVVGGICLGTFNYVAVSSILLALRTLPTSTFYAAYNVGVVIITSTAGWLLFKEKLPMRKIVGIVLAIAAIAVVMIN